MGFYCWSIKSPEAPPVFEVRRVLWHEALNNELPGVYVISMRSLPKAHAAQNMIWTSSLCVSSHDSARQRWKGSNGQHSQDGYDFWVLLAQGQLGQKSPRKWLETEVHRWLLKFVSKNRSKINKYKEDGWCKGPGYDLVWYKMKCRNLPSDKKLDMFERKRRVDP